MPPFPLPPSPFPRAHGGAGRTRFHKDEPNPTLVEFLPTLLAGRAGERARVLVPLCGKTLDLAWLASQPGVREVYGTEGVNQALEDLRATSGLGADVTEMQSFDHTPLLPESASTSAINSRHYDKSDLALGALRRRLGVSRDAQHSLNGASSTGTFFKHFALWLLKVADKPVYVLEGDHFDLAHVGELDGKIDAVWDRGARNT